MQISDGFKSTEFWLVIALLGLVVMNGPLSLGLSATELLSMAIGVAGYSGSRGLAKASPNTTVVQPVVRAETAAETAVSTKWPG